MARLMKESGVEWISDIPQDWEMVRLKYYCRVNNGKEINVELSKDDADAIEVFGSGGVFKYTDKSLYDGEAVLFGRKGTLGKPIYVNQKFWTVDTMYYLTFEDKLYPKFNYYQMIAFDWKSYITQTALPSVVATQVVACKFVFPNYEEQKKIANYLDSKIGEIEDFLTKTRVSIEEYKKYKQAIITKVALGGLDKAVATKNSGIDWIGNIPEHWQIKPFKFVMTERNEKNIPVKTDERLALSIDKGITTYAEKTTNLDRFKDDVTQYKLAYEGDLVFNSMNMIVGAIGYSNYFGCVSPVYYTYYDNVEGHYTSKYYEYIFRSKTMRKVLFSLGKGIMAIDRGDDKINTCRLKVSRDDLRCLKVPVPTEQEQQEIVKYLDTKCAEIDALIAKKEAFVEEMEAYKKSLIYEYVTGKKEVL